MLCIYLHWQSCLRIPQTRRHSVSAGQYNWVGVHPTLLQDGKYGEIFQSLERIWLGSALFELCAPMLGFIKSAACFRMDMWRWNHP